MSATIILLFSGDGPVTDIERQASHIKSCGYQIKAGSTRKGTPYLIATENVIPMPAVRAASTLSEVRA